jgi:hypothetical protein
VAVGHLHAYVTLNNYRIPAKALTNPGAQPGRISRLYDHHITADQRLQFLWSPNSDEPALVQDPYAVAVFGLVENVRGEQNAHTLLIAEPFEGSGEIDPCPWIQTTAWLIHQQ